MKKYILSTFLLCLILLSAATRARAQTDSLEEPETAADTATAAASHPLQEVIVKAYGQNSPVQNVAAPVETVSKGQLERYSNTGILSALNTQPGIKMEERSPGSYRLNIRGSSLQSPFGVSNVKIYYNDIPYTDPGGNTYLNQLGYYNFSSIEVIKGPGSSLYGSGTGGVVLISSMPANAAPGAQAAYTGGSYGLSSAMGEVRLGDTAHISIIRFQHLQADGYRANSRVNKDVASWDATLRKAGRSQISAHFLYGNLTYQTPGALTLTEYNRDASQARPTANGIPGATQSQATIYQQLFLAGFTDEIRLSSRWQNTTTLYGYYAQQRNPNLRNYSRTSEPNTGARTTFGYTTPLGSGTLQWLTGAEVQQGFTTDKVYANVSGIPGLLQSDQEINSRQLFGFTQLTAQVGRWVLTAGASLNQLRTALTTFGSAAVTESRTFNNQLAPRGAVLYKVKHDISVYATVERGFSPPTTTELFPTGSPVNLSLSPQQGINYEAGTRGYLAAHRLYYDASIYYFTLKNTIVERRDSAAGDHYINAGATRQAGIDAYAGYQAIKRESGFVTALNVSAAYTYSYFRYHQFAQLTADYSGNSLPGVAPSVVSATADIATHTGIYLDLSYYYSAKLPLNDANTAYANAYHLADARLGYRLIRRRYSFDIYGGINNLLNQKYSLGNDINAAGGRYYNAAAPVNYFAGIVVGYEHGR